MAARLVPVAQSSSLLIAADLSDLRITIRKMVAALSFKEYQYYEAHLMNWEDSVYGVQPASQQERYIATESAAEQFTRAVVTINHTLLFVQTDGYPNILPSQTVPSVSEAQLRPETAFIMMMMSEDRPELDDVKVGIKETFREFHIDAVGLTTSSMTM